MLPHLNYSSADKLVYIRSNLWVIQMVLRIFGIILEIIQHLQGKNLLTVKLKIWKPCVLTSPSGVYVVTGRALVCNSRQIVKHIGLVPDIISSQANQRSVRGRLTWRMTGSVNIRWTSGSCIALAWRCFTSSSLACPERICSKDLLGHILWRGIIRHLLSPWTCGLQEYAQNNMSLKSQDAWQYHPIGHQILLFTLKWNNADLVIRLALLI